MFTYNCKKKSFGRICSVICKFINNYSILNKSKLLTNINIININKLSLIYLKKKKDYYFHNKFMGGFKIISSENLYNNNLKQTFINSMKHMLTKKSLIINLYKKIKYVK